MKRLWVAAALAPLTFAASAHAVGPTNISTNTTTALATSTSGDITVTGSVQPAAGPAAITIDSANTVNNSGTVAYTGVSNSAAIQANGGNTGEVINSGTISNTESTTGTTTVEGITAGPYANGNNRYGVLFTGAGAFTGIADSANNNAITVINNSGSISVVGENSAGVYATANLSGDIVNSGSITVVGGNSGTSDVSYGIHTVGTVSGDVLISGAVSATGQNAVGVALDQGANSLNVNSSITATGYRETTNPGLAIAPDLDATQLLKGGPALYVGGNVPNGILIVQPVTATSTVTGVLGGSVISYGSAPALLIGGASPLTIGNVGATPANAYGLIVGGSVVGSGVYNDVNATAIQIGGANPLPVAIGGVASGGNFASASLGGGVSIVGTVSAISLEATAGSGNATGLYISSGASVPTVNVSGSLLASGEILAGGSAASPPATTVVALKIDGTASVPSITNSGVIGAIIAPNNVLQNSVAVPTGGATGLATAIVDTSGSVTSITNTNTIEANYLNSSAQITARGTAIDLSANTTTATITQNTYAGAVAGGNSLISGDIHFGTAGSGDLELLAGSVIGNVSYGSGTNTLNIEGDANGGATLTGNLTSTGSLAVSITKGGKLFMNNTPTIAVSNFTLGSSTTVGTIVFSADPLHAANGVFNVSGTATLNAGSTVGLNFLSAITAPEAFTVINATPGNLTVASGANAATIGQLPFLYAASFNTSKYASGQLEIDVSRKTAAQLGFSQAEAALYNPFYAAFSSDPAVLADVLSKTSQTDLKRTYDQFLPDFAGGPFETLSVGQQAIYRAQSEGALKLGGEQSRGWVQEIGYLDHRDNTDSAGYDGSGFGVAAGLENVHGDSALGVSAAFLTTKVKDAAQSAQGDLSASVLEAGLYWRSGGSGLNANASINGGWSWFSSKRMLLDADNGGLAPLVRTAESDWNGGLIAANFGISAPFTVGRYYMRPEVSADYFALYESAHGERGGGSAFDLFVGARTSQELSAQADIVLGANFGTTIKWRPELTLGYRDVVAGGPASTTAQFAGGSSFTLSPNFQDKGGLLARLGVRAGGAFADFSADAGGEYRSGSQSYDARALARFLF